MRVIIRCAGGNRRWGNFGGAPKHLVELAGERLIDRTVRIAAETCPDADIRIVVPDLADRRYMVTGSRRATDKPTPDRGDVDKIASSLPLFDQHDRTVVLFGDVWWTTTDLASILTDPLTDGWGAWLRISDAGGEIFGFAFDPPVHELVATACETVADAHRQGRMNGIPGGWGLYRTLCGRDVTDHGNHGHAHPVDTWTDDMDTPHDWDEWCWRWAHTDPTVREEMIR